LAWLPQEVAQLDSLNHLDLWNNQLSTLPDALSQSSRLRWIDVRGNPVSLEVQKIWMRRLPKTKVYFSKTCNCGG
jgi:hypothetical protein